MSSVNPIRKGPSPAGALGRSERGSRSAATAAKVSQTVRLPKVGGGGLRGRQITPLHAAQDLLKEVRKRWNLLEPQELAERIIELEDRVACLTEPSAAVEKVKKMVEHLHFEFVFPVAAELKAGFEKGMPPSFASVIQDAAKRVLQGDSMRPFHRLNGVQQREIMRIAARGEG